ncbi:hypothetical protein [Leptothermofonsia sp. ETS-13]|uniref:hypothetical protein n=1 Tax=Leptothermofonsia sp. ETS-13 TaxID=3035696 RepID=UPI003B9FF312
MVGSVERIEQDLAAIQGAIASLAGEFYNAYTDYLNLLGKTVRQQLILASYHVCTQGYPERFLSLSYNQRYELQQTLRRLAYQTQEELLAQLHPIVVPADIKASALPDSLPLSEASVNHGIAVPESAPPKAQKPPLTPMHLVQWQQDLEQAITQELQTASHAANRLLQQANVLPPKLPEPILEAAAKADAAEMGGRTPNLMNLLIETTRDDSGSKEGAEESRGQVVMHIVAIHLRLTELEFSEPALNAARTRIRSLQAQLKTLGRDYQKKQRERAIAEAQLAWRASWIEE